MRIISGKYKGKKLFQPKDALTRPLKDLTKESIFNLLTHSNKLNIQFVNANILDLFSGIGSFGIECLSRGVKQVIFVENYEGVLPILKKNLNNLKFGDNHKILEKNIYKNNLFLNLNITFDIIFIDPPYRDTNIDKLVTLIKDSKILNKNGIIVLHRHKNAIDNFPKDMKILVERKYGISKIVFLSY